MFKKKIAQFIKTHGKQVCDTLIYFYYEPQQTYWILWANNFLMSSKMNPNENNFSMTGFKEQQNYNEDIIEHFINTYKEK